MLYIDKWTDLLSRTRDLHWYLFKKPYFKNYLHIYAFSHMGRTIMPIKPVLNVLQAHFKWMSFECMKYYRLVGSFTPGIFMLLYNSNNFIKMFNFGKLIHLLRCK